jgi:2-isopropylmalate synthase
VHLYNATAPVMRKVVLGLDEDGVVDLAVTHARLVRDLAAQQSDTDWTFQYSPEMFSGTELAFSKRVVDAVTTEWQPTPERKCIINLPSTVEHSTPNITGTWRGATRSCCRCTRTMTVAPARRPASLR